MKLATSASLLARKVLLNINKRIILAALINAIVKLRYVRFN